MTALRIVVIDAIRFLCDDAFQVQLADQLIELRARASCVIDIGHIRRPGRQNALEFLFPLNQRQLSQVLAIQEEKIERHITHLFSPGHHGGKDASALVIGQCKFAV